MKYYLTLDIGGTDIKYGVINLDEKIVFKDITKTEGNLGAKHLMYKIITIFNDLNEKYQLEGISISTTGGIDDSNNVLFENLSIKDYHLINFANELKSLNVPVTSLNDVNAMGYAEVAMLNDYEKLKCVVTMTVGTGIGGAIFYNNKLFTGFKHTAGEIGKAYMSNSNETFEDLASTSSLVRNAKEIYEKIENGKQVFELYDKGDEKIGEVVNQFYNNLANGIASVVYTLNPNNIIIGGGITARGDKFLNELMAKLKDKLVSYLYDSLTITIAHHKNDAGMIGAFKYFKMKNNL